MICAWFDQNQKIIFLTLGIPQVEAYYQQQLVSGAVFDSDGEEQSAFLLSQASVPSWRLNNEAQYGQTSFGPRVEERDSSSHHRSGLAGQCCIQFHLIHVVYEKATWEKGILFHTMGFWSFRLNYAATTWTDMT